MQAARAALFMRMRAEYDAAASEETRAFAAADAEAEAGARRCCEEEASELRWARRRVGRGEYAQ
jgi:hypothetical protein